jgi:hypothetical protein
MDGYEVEIEALQTAADAANAAAEQVRDVSSASAVDKVPGAMPGSAVSTAITGWAEWFDQERLQAWATAAADHGERLDESADLYAENEEAAAAAFGSVDHGGVRPV